MKPKKRQKLCHHCEGEVDLDVIVCPFCAADLREEKPEQQRNGFSSAPSSLNQINTEHTLYPPPYNRIREEEPQDSLSTSEYTLPKIPKSEKEDLEFASLRQTILGISLFTLGVHLFLLALMMIFFSKQGVLLFQWKAGFWPFYLIGSVPLLMFGYRLLKKLNS